MDVIEVGNVSTTSGVAAGAHDEHALLQRSINENTISFQQGRSWEKMGECLRRYARRSSGQEIHDFTVLVGLLPASDVLSSLPACLAPESYRDYCTGSLRDCVRSPGDLQCLAEIFCHGNSAAARALLASEADQLALPGSFRFPFDVLLRDNPPAPVSFLRDRSRVTGEGSPAPSVGERPNVGKSPAGKGLSPSS
jgi:hypothetical protein